MRLQQAIIEGNTEAARKAGEVYKAFNTVNIKNNYHLIDTLYIVEDPLTNIKFAKKGNSYRHFNLAKLKKMTVADAYSIEEFNNEYNIRYGVDDKTLDEVVANYTALANQL
jgi:hypothetical protein